MRRLMVDDMLLAHHESDIQAWRVIKILDHKIRLMVVNRDGSATTTFFPSKEEENEEYTDEIYYDGQVWRHLIWDYIIEFNKFTQFNSLYEKLCS